ncbi:transcriptional regulator, CdaR family [Bacillus sp. UNCCL13]|nr:helix-turn-helix domain-containing protein [Bacillus sp. cl95]SFA77437.1 transcriptional regulator, CdaR family [Bacillus sp. UNCCL13]
MDWCQSGNKLTCFFQNDVIGVIGITGEPDVVTPFGEIIRKMTELLISENFYAEQFDWQSRATEAFVFDLIQGREWDTQFLNNADLLSINLTIPRIVAIIDFGSMDSPVTRDGWYTLLNWFRDHENDVPLRWRNERIVVLFASDGNKQEGQLKHRLHQFLLFIKNHIGTEAYVGVGQSVLPQDLQISYHQAERALKTTRNENPIVFDGELRLEMIFEEIKQETKIEFMNRTIGPALHDSELVHTIKELIRQNQSLKNTAESLHIHINTLHYRIKKFEELTGYHPGNLENLVTIYLALRFLDENTKINC